MSLLEISGIIILPTLKDGRIKFSRIRISREGEGFLVDTAVDTYEEILPSDIEEMQAPLTQEVGEPIHLRTSIRRSKLIDVQPQKDATQAEVGYTIDDARDLIREKTKDGRIKFSRIRIFKKDGGYLINAAVDSYVEILPLSQTRQWYRITRRQTIIKDHQLPLWFQAVSELENETIRDYILFILFTGSRKEEGLTLEVEQVDLKSRAYTVLDPKNWQPLTLPLPSYLFGILERRIKNLKGFKYVFPGFDKSGNLLKDKHLKEPRVQVAKVVEASEVKFTLHDLRRHFITLADSLDLSTFSVKRLVNHSMGSDVTGGYIVSDLERLREPMQKIEDRILRLAGVTKPGKVVQIKRA